MIPKGLIIGDARSKKITGCCEFCNGLATSEHFTMFAYTSVFGGSQLVIGNKVKTCKQCASRVRSRAIQRAWEDVCALNLIGRLKVSSKKRPYAYGLAMNKAAFVAITP